jgi:hypothetical protein
MIDQLFTEFDFNYYYDFAAKNSDSLPESINNDNVYLTYKRETQATPNTLLQWFETYDGSYDNT